MMPTTNQLDNSKPSDGWTLNGWHVLASLIVFFGVMIAANGVFLYYAVTTFTGIETADAYRKGVAYNASLENARQIKKLGWTGTLKATTSGIEFTLRNAEGEPVRGVRVKGKIGRPATDSYDQTVTFEDVGSGQYRSRSMALAPGNWIATIEAHDPVGGDTALHYRLKERLWISQ